MHAYTEKEREREIDGLPKQSQLSVCVHCIGARGSGHRKNYLLARERWSLGRALPPLDPGPDKMQKYKYIKILPTGAHVYVQVCKTYEYDCVHNGGHVRLHHSMQIRPKAGSLTSRKPCTANTHAEDREKNEFSFI